MKKDETGKFIGRGDRRVSTRNVEREKDFLDVLKLFSPGTSIRNALDDILRARIGALIAIDKGSLLSIVDGGFRVNTKFSPQKLVELAKMDGAIILSEDMKKILYANTLLVPDVHIKTRETGTRHKAAERTSKQIKTIIIAVSKRKNKITVYYGNARYVLEDSSEILRRATETLQIIEKQKDILDELFTNLNILEINNLATSMDVCNVIQKMEIIQRTSDIIKRYLIELGKEGIIVSMRLKELTRNLSKEKNLLIEDYFPNSSTKIKNSLKDLNFDSLLELSNLQRVLFGDAKNNIISSKGKRILSKLNLSEEETSKLINSFENIGNILDIDKESLFKIREDKDSASSLKTQLDGLKEKIMEGKII